MFCEAIPTFAPVCAFPITQNKCNVYFFTLQILLCLWANGFIADQKMQSTTKRLLSTLDTYNLSFLIQYITLFSRDLNQYKMDKT